MIQAQFHGFFWLRSRITKKNLLMGIAKQRFYKLISHSYWSPIELKNLILMTLLNCLGMYPSAQAVKKIWDVLIYFIHLFLTWKYQNLVDVITFLVMKFRMHWRIIRIKIQICGPKMMLKQLANFWKIHRFFYNSWMIIQLTT